MILTLSKIWNSSVDYLHFFLIVIDTFQNSDMDYCPYELAARQMKELMEESRKASQQRKFSSFSTKEFSDHEWQNYCNEAKRSTIERRDTNPVLQNLEQNENQIDYYVESNSIIYGDGKSRGGEPLENPVCPGEDFLIMQHTKPKSSMRLMLTDFPDLNSETDESDSFKDFLRLEAEMLKGSPSPKSIRGDRKNSVESEKDGNETHNEDNSSYWYDVNRKERL